MKRKAFVFLGVFTIFLSGFFLGGSFFPSKQQELERDPGISENRLREGYAFINPLLECSLVEFADKGLNAIDAKLNTLIKKLQHEGKVTDVAVYYRDLNNGPWFGINEKMDFSPASLLKLPVMMAYYKKAENEPEILDRKVIFEKDREYLIPQDITPGKKLEKGKEYSINELIERMIVYSDNASLLLLEEHIAPELIDKVTIDLGIVIPTGAATYDFITVKDYSSLFRVLFNASYLSREYSEKALKLLSVSEYRDGIVAGVERGVVVSNKMGEREISDSTKQLHDCGIVYVPGKPYLICIMTRGSNLSNLSDVIRQISSTVYYQVKSH